MSHLCVVHTDETQATAALTTEEDGGVSLKVFLKDSEVMHIHKHTHWFHLSLKVSTYSISWTVPDRGLVAYPFWRNSIL